MNHLDAVKFFHLHEEQSTEKLVVFKNKRTERNY